MKAGFPSSRRKHAQIRVPLNRAKFILLELLRRVSAAWESTGSAAPALLNQDNWKRTRINFGRREPLLLLHT